MIKLYEETDPEVTSGQFDIYGFTPAERRLYETRKREGSAMGGIKHAPPTRPRDVALPGMEDRAIQPIEDAVNEWRDLKDRQRALTATMAECKAGLIALLHRHKKAHYKRRGVEITLTAGVEKIRIVCETPTPDQDDKKDKPREERRRPPRAPDPTPEAEPPIEHTEPPTPARELH